MSNIIMADSPNKAYFTDSGLCYTEHFVPPKIVFGVDSAYKGAYKMKTLVCGDNRTLGGSSGTKCNLYFQDCTALESIEFPYIQGIGSSFIDYLFAGCTSLKNATFGSIGHPITQFANTTYRPIFNGDKDLTITIYVNADTLSEIPIDVTNRQPWGATNATVVYRNSTTGEVII